jgi:phosphoadenosine phosphosulfate reductase
MDKVDKAIERLKLGSDMSLRYYGKPLMITYSGGKDSEVLADLAIKAKIPIELVNNHTTADAPPTVYHIRNQFKKWENDGIDCKIVYPKYKGISTSMWELIPIKKMPPTRLARYCCAVLKETTGNGRMIATGVRWAESVARENGRGVFEELGSCKAKNILLDDNDVTRRLFENCSLKAKRVVNPIIDWSDAEVWDYADSEKLCMNLLYECGFNRVGCIGCPMAGKSRYTEFQLFPKYRDLYIAAFDRMLKVRKSEGKDDSTGGWYDARAVFHWWMQDGVLPGQIEMEDILNESFGSL